MTLTQRDSEAVLFANEAFYLAFAAGDYDQMDGLWAETTPVACLHPGWGPIYGRDDVMTAWRSLLQGPPPVQCREATVIGLSPVATVICFEEIQGQYLIATNIFVREGDGNSWRMIHHHASPTQGAPQEAAQMAPSVN